MTEERERGGGTVGYREGGYQIVSHYQNITMQGVGIGNLT